MNIISSSTPMRSKPQDTSNLETECLFGEQFEILEEFSDWYFGRLLTDNYCGWVKKIDVGYQDIITHRVISNRSFLFNDETVKSNTNLYLPLGSQLSVENVKPNWTSVRMPNKAKKNLYIPSNHIIEINQNIIDWISIAEALVGTPYKFGGRDTLGLDCSALLQLSYQTYGKNIPRNSIDQANIPNKIISNINELKRGCVVFWVGHVAIMVDKYNCIHANAFHMSTVIEPLKKVISRMCKQDKIVKMMDFN